MYIESVRGLETKGLRMNDVQRCMWSVSRRLQNWMLGIVGSCHVNVDPSFSMYCDRVCIALRESLSVNVPAALRLLVR